MVLIAAIVGYSLIRLFTGKRMAFHHFFAIYALSSAVTLMISWIPVFIVPAEIWKWWLIGIGLIKIIGLWVYQAVITIGLSVFIITILVYSLSFY